MGVEDAGTLDGLFVYLIPETLADDSAEIEVEVFGTPMPLGGHYSAWITLRGDGTIDPYLVGYHVWMETAGGRTYVGIQRNGEQLPLDAPGMEVPHAGLGVHRLTAVLRGGTLTAYWDGVLLKSVSDPSPLPPGHPGFGLQTNIAPAGQGDAQESQVRVTSFEVWLEPEVRIEAANGSMEVRPERTTGSAPLDLKIGVYNAQGEPQRNRTVTLTLTPTELSAGHDHEDGKPAGTLSHQNPVPTGPSGEVIVKYTAPPPSGPVTIRGTSSGAQEASETINVGVPGLVPIARNGEHHGFQSSNLHASNDFYMAPGALDVMTQIWRRYVEKGDPISPSKKFTITAATLVSGGLYDYRGTWAPPHSTHRQGGDMDFDDAVAEASPQFIEQVCSKFKFGGLKVVCELHNGNHIHAYLGPNR